MPGTCTISTRWTATLGLRVPPQALHVAPLQVHSSSNSQQCISTATPCLCQLATEAVGILQLMQALCTHGVEGP